MSEATSQPSGTVVAIKKSRVSLRVKRTILRHEARVLQLLQGHPAVPKLVGYGRNPHFEYIAMELLGQSVRALVVPGKAIPLETVRRIGGQMVGSLRERVPTTVDPSL